MNIKHIIPSTTFAYLSVVSEKIMKISYKMQDIFQYIGRLIQSYILTHEYTKSFDLLQV